MRKTTVSELKKMLPMGTIFTATFLRPVIIRGNTGITSADSETTQRIVVRQTRREIISEITEGPKKGREVFLTLSELSVVITDDGSVELTLKDEEKPFARYTNIQPKLL